MTTNISPSANVEAVAFPDITAEQRSDGSNLDLDLIGYYSDDN